VGARPVALTGAGRDLQPLSGLKVSWGHKSDWFPPWPDEPDPGSEPGPDLAPATDAGWEPEGDAEAEAELRGEPEGFVGAGVAVAGGLLEAVPNWALAEGIATEVADGVEDGVEAAGEVEAGGGVALAEASVGGLGLPASTGCAASNGHMARPIRNERNAGRRPGELTMPSHQGCLPSKGFAVTPIYAESGRFSYLPQPPSMGGCPEGRRQDIGTPNREARPPRSAQVEAGIGIPSRRRRSRLARSGSPATSTPCAPGRAGAAVRASSTSATRR
jgi:hypothetical protein